MVIINIDHYNNFIVTPLLGSEPMSTPTSIRRRGRRGIARKRPG